MSKAIHLSILAMFFASLADASSPCPLTLVSGAGDRDAIIVTFRNTGRLPIRRLEFNCTLVHSQADKARAVCREENALFFPGTAYTVRYTYPGAFPGRFSCL